MDKIEMVRIFHRGQTVIGLQGARNPLLKVAIRKLKDVRWSQTFRLWYVPFKRESLQEIQRNLGSLADFRGDVWQELSRQEGVTLAQGHLPKPPIHKRVTPESVLSGSCTSRELQPGIISPENCKALERLMQHLRLHGYSPATLRTYRAELYQLVKLLGSRQVDSLTADEIRRYMDYSMRSQGISEHTAHSRINALKYYFEQVLGKQKFFWEIPRPKKPLLLPRVLSEAELCRLFNAVCYLKHKAILFTAYSAGLRVSEVARLQWKHIDRSRGQILIERSKGKKDRYVALSPLLEDILISYYRGSDPKPEVFVFESRQPGMPYSVRSMQAVFQEARQKAGIHKQVGFHSLRHSFATHLLEKGTDVRYIQELLGHFNIRTTTRYLHVARKDLVAIRSPLDTLFASGGLQWDGR